MIEFSRALAHRFRAVLRRSLMADNPRSSLPIVQCRTDETGLTLEARHGEVGLRYHEGGAHPAEVIAFRAALLAEIEGRTDVPVTVEVTELGKGRARWVERGVPRVVEFEPVAADAVPAFATLPEQLLAMQPEFLRALADAAATAGKESTRFATTRIQLRGRGGDVVATDGRQMLAQGGFRFPWAEDVLVPALPVFGLADLFEQGPVELGRTANDVTLRVGPWTFVLSIDKAGRFPTTASVVPKLTAVKSRLRIDPEDAAFLAEALPKLPGHADDHAPVTLTLGSRVALQAWSEAGGPAVDITLGRSAATGEPTQIRTDRQYLRRALRMGFAELHVTAAEQALSCRDRRRCYVWMPLDPEATMPAHADVQHISTAETGPVPATPNANGSGGADEVPTDVVPADRPLTSAVPADSTPAHGVAVEPTQTSVATANPPRTRRTVPMPTQNGDGHREKTVDAQAPGGLADLIAEAEALRDLLHGAFSRCSRLVSALKLQRRQTKAVQQAVESLKQLQLNR